MVSLTTQLEQLEYAQLVRRLQEEELAYLFKHALTQERAYESILIKRRREIHRRVAQAHEQLYPERLDEFAALLAEHYSRAGDDAKTLEFSIRAAEAAVRIFAQTEALAHYTRAMDAFTRLPDTEELRRQRVDVILGYLNYSWGTALSDAEFVLATQAEALAHSLRNPDGTLGDPRRLARIHLMRAGGHIARSEYQEASRYDQQLLVQAPVLADDTLVATASAQFGLVLVLQGHFAEAEPYLVKAISRLVQTPDRWEWFSSVGPLGISLAMRGQVGAGLAQIERALARADATENAFGITLCRGFLLVIYLALGDMSRLLGESKRAIEAAVKSGHPVYFSLGLGFRALAESRLGKLAHAQETLIQAYEVKAKFGGQLMMSDWQAVIGAEVIYSAGRTQEALTLAGQTVAMAQSIGGIFVEGWARRIWAQALAKQESPPWDEVEEQLAESVRMHESGEARLEAARTHVVWGQLRQTRGDAASAREHFEKAAGQFQTSGLMHELERTKQLIASLPA
jgi:hypothetical protein